MLDILFLMRNNFKNKGIWYTTENVANYLNSIGVTTKIDIIEDFNLLNNIVNLYKPSIIFVEAIWLHPNKIKNLLKDNDFIKRVVIHYHSDLSFFATEVFGMEWTYYYNNISDKITVSANCENFASSFDFIEYLPNIYDKNFKYNKIENNNIVLYQPGAVRLMKNHLTQMIASIKFGDKINKKILYRYNNLQNNGGESVYRNLNSIANNTNHFVDEIDWINGKEYINYIKKTDIGLQLSFSESFNNVAADFVVNGKPVLVGDTIDWLPDEYKSSSYTNINKIVDKLEFLFYNKDNIKLLEKAYNNLVEFNNNSKLIWKKFIENVY